MDENELRESILRGIEAEHAERRAELLAEAASIRERFESVTDIAERTAMKARYFSIDRELERIKPVGDVEEGYSARGKRQKAKGEIEWDAYLEKIERGRKHVVEKGRAGAGVNTFGRIKGELDYLLRHYTPGNDAKIETLIDKWRTSGDPSYDPSVKARLRNARAKKSKSDNPI